MANTTTSKRSYRRRSSEERIAELKDQIRQIEARELAKVRTDAPVLKEFKKVKRHLAKFAQVCVDHQRNDLSNSILAFIKMMEKQSEELPANLRAAASEE